MAQDSGNEVIEQPSAGAEGEQGGAHAVSARKPGMVGRSLDSAKGFIGSVPSPAWDLRTFFYMLIGLVAVVLLARNWAPMRVDIFGWHMDLPMPVWFVINLAIGAGLLRLWQLRSRSRADQSDTG